MTFVETVIKIRNWLFIVLRYAILFATMATIVFLIISIISYYVLIEYAGIDLEISALIAGVVSAIIIVILDFKKFHFHKKMHQHITNSIN